MENKKIYMKLYMKEYRKKKQSKTNTINQFLLANLNSKAIDFSNENGVILSYGNFIKIEEIEDNDMAKNLYEAYITLMLNKSNFKTNFNIDFVLK